VSASPPSEVAPGRLLNPADDVAIVLADVAAGQRVRAGTDEVVALVDIQRGHKVALRTIGVDEPGRKWPAAPL
jgi:predicted RecA/RadA family phage recombinase